MSSYRVPSSNTADTLPEVFRKYLEDGGVLEAIQSVLVELFIKGNDRPENPLEYLKERLSISAIDGKELESLRNEVKLLINQVEKLEQENENLRGQLNCKQLEAN